MRLERVDIDGFGPLSGSFWFPAEGVGVWAAPNGSGKSVLIEAVTAGLYGDPAPSRIPSEARSARAWIMVHVTRDDGESFVIARDLRSDTAQITDARGEDVTHRLGEGGRPVGEVLLGITREEFEEVAGLGFDSLATTACNATLLRLLKQGRSGAGPGTRPIAAPADAPSRDATPTPDPRFASDPASESGPAPAVESEPIPEVGEDDLTIVRSAAEELGYAEPGSIAEGARPDFDGEPSLDDDVLAPGHRPSPPAGPDPAPASTAPVPAPDDPGLEAIERLRRMRDGLTRLDDRREEKRRELQLHSDRVLEYQTEAERLGMLTGAEPENVDQLGRLLETMKEVRERKERIRIEEDHFQRDLEARASSIERLRQLDAEFRDLDAGHQEFIENYRKAETIRRGNQALIRSESRLEDAKIEEIEQARTNATRLALYPFLVSVLGLFGHVALRFLPVPVLDPNLLLVFGLVAAGAGAAMLLRAKGLREEERERLLDAQIRKKEQLEELEKEAKYVFGQLHVLAEQRGLDNTGDLLERFELWKANLTDIRVAHEFETRYGEIREEVSHISEQLSTFGAGKDAETDPLHLGADATEAMYRDYVRFFEVHSALERAESESMRLEEDLVGIETETADLRDTIAEILSAADIDAGRDVDEAIAMFSARQESGEIENVEDVESIPKPRAGDSTLELEAITGDVTWTSPLSARVEAILRRLIPDARELEVDDRLRPSFKLDPRGPRLGLRQLAAHLSAPEVDQVCLALRLAIVETLSASGEGIPVFLHDPLARADDARHGRALDFLVEDASNRMQIVFLTAHEVRSRWFLHQHPEHEGRLGSIREPAPSASSASSSSLGSPSPSS